jgi:4-nitrophenyl phosphatase
LRNVDFSVIRAVVMDMDGVLWRGDEALPGLQAWFDFLRERRLPFALATNNSSKSPDAYVAKLARMGVNHVPESSIITSGTATAVYMQARYPAGVPVHVLGGSGLKQVIAAAGYPLVEAGARVVVAGIDFELTYEKLKRAALCIRAGADFIGTNPDVTYPSPEGLVPGAGSVIAALAAASERQPVIIGKPNAPIFEGALALLGTSADHTLMIGDRLSTDISGAQVVGLWTALVLTGVSTREEAGSLPKPPDGVYDDLPALLRALRESPEAAKKL